MSFPASVPSRRTVLRTAAWTLPAVSVATAAPAFAGSVSPDVDLWATLQMPPNQGMSGGGTDIYTSQSHTFSATFGNRGPDDLPRGSHFMLGLGFGAFWELRPLTLPGVVFSHVSTDFETFATPPGTQAELELWTFSLDQPMPVGSSITVQFTADLLQTPSPDEVWSHTPTTPDDGPGGPGDGPGGPGGDPGSTPSLYPPTHHEIRFSVGASGATNSGLSTVVIVSPDFLINQPT